MMLKEWEFFKYTKKKPIKAAEVTSSRDGKSARIRAVTLGSNFTARISCQVSFCRCKISGLELIFSVVDLDFRAVD